MLERVDNVDNETLSGGEETIACDAVTVTVSVVAPTPFTFVIVSVCTVSGTVTVEMNVNVEMLVLILVAIVTGGGEKIVTVSGRRHSNGEPLACVESRSTTPRQAGKSITLVKRKES